MRPLTATCLALSLSLAGAGMMGPAASQAQVAVGISVGVAPPALPYYEQPPIPGPGYIWTPGYWAWGDYDYYWVPGLWVQPPAIGLLWTPPWWGFVDGAYVFNVGYWGPFVGFYGGINYGFGYGGFGYDGGYWRGRDFYYNRSVNNVSNINVRNVYSRPATAGGFSRASFNGPGGAQARPTDRQVAAARTSHIGATPAQRRQAQVARAQPALRANLNRGAPPIAATARPGRLHGPAGVTTAHAGAAYHQQTASYRPSTAARSGHAPGAGPAHVNVAGRAAAGYNATHRSMAPAATRYAGGYRPTPRSQESFRTPSRPPQAFAGGFRASPAMARPSQSFREARAAPAAAQGGRHR